VEGLASTYQDASLEEANENAKPSRAQERRHTCIVLVLIRLNSRQPDHLLACKDMALIHPPSLAIHLITSAWIYAAT
jgi:hypothetical protein